MLITRKNEYTKCTVFTHNCIMISLTRLIMKSYNVSKYILSIFL